MTTESAVPYTGTAHRGKHPDEGRSWSSAGFTNTRGIRGLALVNLFHRATGTKLKGGDWAMKANFFNSMSNNIELAKVYV